MMESTRRVAILVLCSLLGVQALSISDVTNFGLNFYDGTGEAVYTSILSAVGSIFCKFDKDGDYDLNQLTLYHYSFDVDGIVTTLYNVSNGAGPLYRSMGPYSANYSYHFYFSGFNSGPDGVMTTAYQSLNDSNIKFFSLDHSEYTDVGTLVLNSYYDAVKYTYHIGKQMGVYLSELVNYGVPIENIYVFGHSLGAHMTGVCSDHLKNLTGQSLPRITGLDPARPCFSDKDMEYVIDDSDADYVDILHCNAGGLGWANNYGSADFYPDGGKSQPACTAIQIFLYYNIEVSACSHNICPTYFALSLEDPLVGQRCDSYENYTARNCAANVTAVFGQQYNATENGTYYLTIE